MEQSAQENPEKSGDPLESFRSGFVALLGRTNAGKSTLLNALLGEKVAPTNPKPQTTRRRLRGILSTDSHQFIFIDTPGYHAPEDALGERLLATADRAVKDADAILVVVDASDFRAEDQKLIELARRSRSPFIVAANKIDRVNKAQAELPAELQQLTAPLVTISALKRQGLDELLEKLGALLPLSPPYYDVEQLTVENLRELAAELIREAVLECLHQEIPYALEAIIDEYTPRSEEMTYLSATLYVERKSQVGIVVGKQGVTLKKIGSRARQKLQQLIETKVFLDIRVKVRPKWRKNKNTLREFGYTP
ncbi:GTPase Era [bacterium]|nr:GTPase Era [bacterium]